MTFVDFALGFLNFDRDELMSFDNYMENIVNNNEKTGYTYRKFRIYLRFI